MTRIHANYDLLLDHERAFVDDTFEASAIYATAKSYGVSLMCDDRIERAVDALARAVIESRDSETASDALVRDMLA